MANILCGQRWGRPFVSGVITAAVISGNMDWTGTVGGLYRVETDDREKWNRVKYKGLSDNGTASGPRPDNN